MRNMYPNDYKNITFVFHDVDTLPYKKGLLNYETCKGVVKHFYGFNFALGGIFSITGEDFERTGGFPNFWAWGGEDNVMQSRVLKMGLIIERDNFYKIGDRNILQFADGFLKTINRNELKTIKNNTSPETLNTIRNLIYKINDEYIDVVSFDTVINYDFIKTKFESHDISKGNNKIHLNKNRRKTGRSMIQRIKIFKSSKV